MTMKHLRTTLTTATLLLTTSITAQCDVVNSATFIGEKLEYDAYYNWGFIWLNAAKITFQTTDTIVAGQHFTRFSSIGTTLPAYDFFFSVRDTFLSVVESTTLRPVEFYQNNTEGKTSTFNHHFFNAADSLITGTYRYDNGKSVTAKSIETAWPECSCDVLTMVYRARNIDFSHYTEGDKIPITLLITAEPYDLYIRFQGREAITLRSGTTYNCLKFTPLLVDGTIFTGGEDMTVWVTDDVRRTPVAVEAKILIGSVNAQLR